MRKEFGGTRRTENFFFLKVQIEDLAVVYGHLFPDTALS